MRIAIRGNTVRLYAENSDEQDTMNVLVMQSRRGLHVFGNEKSMFFRMPSDKEMLEHSLKTILGHKRGRFMLERVGDYAHVN